MKKLVAVLLIVLLGVGIGEACNKLKVRQAAEFMFGISFPYWFNYSQLQVESDCKWVTGLDGIGSIGFAQITPKWWEEELRKAGFYNWATKDHFDHFMAHAYILKKFHSQNSCGKLYITYQAYNRSINKVVRENACCDWKRGYERCFETGNQPICVWRSGNMCKQWRWSCDINYEYSMKIYRKGIKMQEWVTKDWIFL